MKQQGLKVDLEKKGHRADRGTGKESYNLTKGRPWDKQATVGTGEA